MPQPARNITVLGAGILGLWQAVTLARQGHRLRLLEASATPFVDCASIYGGVMLAPEREAETAPEMLRALGHEGVALWRALYPALKINGSIVIAGARDIGELDRFASHTQGHRRLSADAAHARPSASSRPPPSAQAARRHTSPTSVSISVSGRARRTVAMDGLAVGSAT